jgi:hypothetical protein
MVTWPASADLSSDQYKFVTLNASGQAAVVSSSAEPTILGVLQNKPTVAGQAASVMISGISKIKATASTVSVGDLVSASSEGFAVALTSTGNAVGRIVAGSSGGAGRVLSVEIQNIGAVN